MTSERTVGPQDDALTGASTVGCILRPRRFILEDKVCTVQSTVVRGFKSSAYHGVHIVLKDQQLFEDKEPGPSIVSIVLKEVSHARANKSEHCCCNSGDNSSFDAQRRHLRERQVVPGVSRIIIADNG